MSLPNRFTGEDLLITFLPDGETEPIVLSGDLTDFQFSRSTSNVDLTAGSGKDRNFSTTKTQYEFDLSAFVNTSIIVKEGTNGLIVISPSGSTYDRGYYFFRAIVNGIDEVAAFDAGYDMNLTGLVTGQILYNDTAPVTNLVVTGAVNGIYNLGLDPPIAWDAVAGALTYTLQYSTASDFTGATEVTGIATNSYTHPSDLVDNTTYYWRVASVGSGGQGDWSDTLEVLVISPYHAAVLALNPDAWWRLDESSGLVAVDSVGGWDAVATAGVTPNQDGAGQNTGKSWSFDGAANNLLVPYSVGLGTLFNYAGAFFWCAWIYPETLPGGSPRIIDRDAAYIAYVATGGTLTFVRQFSDGSKTASLAGVTLNAWNFVAGIVTASKTVQCFLANAANGWTVTAGSATTASAGTPTADTDTGIGIGYRPASAGREWDGYIDSAAIGSGNPTLVQLQGVVDAAGPFDVNLLGAWTWFTEPRALRVGNKTFLGAVDPSGNTRAYQYDHSSGTFRSVILHSSLGVDDHNNSALLVRASDSRLLAFYSAHNGSEYYMRVSNNPLDATAWGTEATLDSSLGMDSYTYANPIQLPGETNDPIWLFFRGDPPGATGWAQYFSKSLDGGATWAAATRWLNNGGERPYLKVIQNGDSRIDFICTDGHPVEVTGCSIYHCYYEGGNWYQSDGTLVGGIGDLPFTPSDFTQVYDGSTIEAWVHDIVIDENGYPVIAYVNFHSTTDHRYRYARWSGSAWNDNEIVAAGTYLYAAQENYSGGISIDPADVNTVYLSREVGDADWEIWRYVTSDGGATWEGTKLTTESGRALRPYVVRNHGSDKKVAYFAGTYTSYTSYDTVIKLIDG